MSEITELKGLVTKLLPVKLLENNNGQIEGVPKNPRFIKDWRYKLLLQSLTESPEMLSLKELWVYKVGDLYVVIAGNMRLRGSKEKGYKSLPCKILPPETSVEKLKEYAIKDNAGYGDWEMDSLANEWESPKIVEWGVELNGWENGEMPFEESETAQAKEDDFDTTPPEVAKTVLGDLYEIGLHRLVCGDATCSDTVAKLMNGEVAEMLFTSPPYSDMRTYEGGKDLSVDNLIEFIPTWLPFANYQVINLGIQRKDHEIVQYWDGYIQKAKECGYKFLSWNVWDKTIGGSIASATAMFLMTHEWIFVFGKDAKKLNRTVENQLDKYEARHGADWQKGIKDKSIRKQDGNMATTSSSTYTHHQIHSCIQQTPELSDFRKNHPAMFPVGLPSEYIKAMTNEGDIVAEPFCGSGTTMVAAHQLKRKVYGCELEPKYCDVIVKRMLSLESTLRVKRNGVDVTEEWRA